MSHLSSGLSFLIKFLTLQTGNILPVRPDVAPALQAHAKELEKHMLADNLEHKIKERPDPDQLIEKGILDNSEDPRSPSE